MRLLAEDLTSELQEQDEMQLTFRWRRPLHLERPDLDVSSHLVLALRQSMDSLDSEELARAELAKQVETSFLRVVGLGDHATATLDAVLMVQKALAEALPEARAFLSVHGLACPQSEAGRHYCRLRCQVLGEPCAGNGANGDPLAEWIERYVFGGGAYELPDFWSGSGQDVPTWSLIAALKNLPGRPLQSDCDLVVCAHPAALCLLSFWAFGRVRPSLQVRCPCCCTSPPRVLYCNWSCLQCHGAVQAAQARAQPAWPPPASMVLHMTRRP
ncbi:unnamed protein product [Durusdinium trenchii]|uniref:Uncharacterized protein n=1 Tax=Durusdinium trenchii TaxID=1381693 RepID=A0ABP0S2J1_9DINO